MKKFIVLLFLLLIACGQPVVKEPTLPSAEGKKLPSGTATTTDGMTISYQMYSNPGKPGVILLHMLGRTRTDWHTIAKWLQENGFAVIAIDFRGHGLSMGDLESFTAQDYNAMVEDVKAAKSVLQAQGGDVSRLSIIGASIGANIALKYAANDLDVKTAVLLSPGLEYRGVKTEAAMSKLNRPVLLVASTDDPTSAESVQTLSPRNPYAQIKMYTDAGHGTNMFAKTDLAPLMLQWLQDHV